VSCVCGQQLGGTLIGLCIVIPDLRCAFCQKHWSFGYNRVSTHVKESRDWSLA
jgi:hypothetical protein